MRKFIKFLKLFFLSMIVLSVVVIGYRIYEYFFVIAPKNEFLKQIGKGDGIILDLREFRKDQWDEMTFWPPYGNICDLGVKGYESGGKNCEYSKDDGEGYLLFLKNKELVIKVDPSWKVDWENSGIKWPIKREDAVFNLVSGRYVRKTPRLKYLSQISPRRSVSTISMNFHGTQYDLTFTGEKFSANQNTQEYRGEFQERKGDFRHWIFRLNKEQDLGFEIIINDKTSKILNQKNDLDAGGPYLLDISPDSQLVAFDYGTGPGPRGFDIRDSAGKILLTGTWLHEFKWTGKAFEYVLPKEVPLDSNAMTRRCADTGAAYKVQTFTFDGKVKKNLNKPTEIVCSS